MWVDTIIKLKDIDLNSKHSTENINYQIKASSDARSFERNYLAEMIRKVEPTWDNFTPDEHKRILRNYRTLRKYSKDFGIAITYKDWDHITPLAQKLEIEFERVRPDLVDDIQEWSVLSE